MQSVGLPPSACIHGSFAGFGRDRITRTLYDENHRTAEVRTGYGSGWEAVEAAYTYRSNGQVPLRLERAVSVYLMFVVLIAIPFLLLAFLGIRGRTPGWWGSA